MAPGLGAVFLRLELHLTENLSFSSRSYQSVMHRRNTNDRPSTGGERATAVAAFGV